MWRENTAAGAVGVRSSKSVGNQPLRFPSLSAGLPGPPESFSIVKRTAKSEIQKKGQEKRTIGLVNQQRRPEVKKTEITIYPESLEAIEKLAESRCSKI